MKIQMIGDMLKISNEIIKRQIISAFLKSSISIRSVFFVQRERRTCVWSVEKKMVLNSVVNPVLKIVAYEMSDWFLSGKYVWVYTYGSWHVMSDWFLMSKVSVSLLHMGRNSGYDPVLKYVEKHFVVIDERNITRSEPSFKISDFWLTIRSYFISKVSNNKM